jgi:DNA-binding HxlR family transcriptional regulator
VRALQDQKFLKALENYDNLKACPIALGFRVLGRRWTIEVIRELFLGHTKFNEIQKNVPGVNPRMLALRLKELEELGLIRREVFSTTPVKIDYSLSNLGRDVIPVMYAMAEFSMKNFPEDVFEDGESRTPEKVYREIALK